MTNYFCPLVIFDNPCVTVLNIIRFPDRDPTGFCHSEPDLEETGFWKKNSTGSDMDIQTASIIVYFSLPRNRQKVRGWDLQPLKRRHRDSQKRVLVSRLHYWSLLITLPTTSLCKKLAVKLSQRPYQVNGRFAVESCLIFHLGCLVGSINFWLVRTENSLSLI